MKLATFIFHSSNRMTAWNQIEAHDIILNCACVDTSSFFRGLVLYEDNRSCPSKDQRIKNNLLAMSSTSTEYFTECFGSIKLRSTTKLEDDKITWHSHRYFMVYIPDYNVIMIVT